MGTTKNAAPVVDEADAAVATLNEKYAVAVIGGKTAIVVEKDGSYALWTKHAFVDFLANQVVWRGEKKVRLSTCFLEHDDTRRYSGITFAPGGAPKGVYNIWRGFSVEPAPGNWGHFKDHLLSNVCSGNEIYFTWVMGWFAHMVQHPGEKIGTSLVLGGESGAGKTIVGEIIGSLFEPHYMLIDHPRLATGNFNAHASSLLMLHADEAFFAGDKAAVGRLRSLVTAKTLPIEYKGRDVEKVRSCVRLLVTSEQPWIVPASRGERRFAVLEVGAHRKDDHAYFEAMMDELANGGREALLHDLMNFDLAGVEVREIPQTAALLDQKLAGLDTHVAFWLGCLERGTVFDSSDDWEGEVRCNQLYEKYRDFAQGLGTRFRLTPEQFGAFLRKMCPALGRRRKRDGQKRLWLYALPSLDQARQDFDSYVAQALPWARDSKE